MSSHTFQTILDTLADQYGLLDNQVERWAGHHQGLIDLFPEIEQALVTSFAEDSEPIRIFEQGRDRYTQLLGDLSNNSKATDLVETASAYLNLRFFILLNAFLQACQESLEKSFHNPSLDPAELVRKSYYTPYFFDRVTVSRTEMIQMLEEEIAQILAAPRDQSGILQAMRTRKGVYATLAESYCPTHPILYPLVQELDAIKVRSNPDVVDEIANKLEEILLFIQA